ncbi:hypothetical protein I3W98_27270, partial [Streptomyces cavourensis]|nr:hypothetical protein [Streptomyces cavourensis]
AGADGRGDAGAGSGAGGGVGAALAEARRLAGVDVERELLRRLEEAYGPGLDALVRRDPVDGEETVTVELLRDGVPAAGADLHTGHAEIATLLEETQGTTDTADASDASDAPSASGAPGPPGAMPGSPPTPHG